MSRWSYDSNAFHNGVSTLGSFLLILLSLPIQAFSNSSCVTPVCPGSRQVVANCSVNDPTLTSNTFWKGTSIVSCGPGDFFTFSHVVYATAPTNMCSGTTFISSFTSKEGTVFTSELSMVPTSSNDEDIVGCYSPGLSDLVLECTLDVLSVDVIGKVEQQGLSGAMVNVGLVESSGFACVDEYFVVIGATRMNNTNSTFVPIDLCSSPTIPNVTVGTSRNGVNGPTVTVPSFTANINNLYSNLTANHTFDESGVTLDFSWAVNDMVVMNQSNVSCCRLSDPELSASPTSHRLQISYGQFTNEQSSSPQVTLSVSYQNGLCSDTESIPYDVTNFGSATVSSSGSDTIFFIFNEELLASGVNVTRIRGRCKNRTQDMFWDYKPNFNISISFVASCDNSSYEFQALSSGNLPIGFSFTIQVNSPTTTVPPAMGVDYVVIGAAVGGCLAGLLAVIVLIVLIALLYCYFLKDNPVHKDAEKDGLTRTNSGQPPADSLYADPNSIEHEAAPGTEDQYAMVDRKVKKNKEQKPTPPEALYQDPNTIEHQTAASGDTYAVVDKPKRSSKKKGGPDVVPPASEGLTYADIDLSSKRPKPGSGRQAPQQPGEYPKEHPVEYSSVDHGNTSQL